MFSFFNSVNNIVTFYCSCSNGKSFSDIFFDKFKNLLDDYIVSYFIKYLFYFLFISFFVIELSYGFCNLVYTNVPFSIHITDGRTLISYNIVGSFLADFFSYLNSFFFVDFLYSFYAFNMDSCLYLFKLVSNDNVMLLYFFICFFIAFIFFALDRVVIENGISFYTVAVLYLLYSFVFFIFYSIGIISISFFVLTTFILFFFSSFGFFGKNISLCNIDYYLLGIIFVSSLLPTAISLSILYFFSVLYLILTEEKVKSKFNLYKDSLIIFDILFYFFFLMAVALRISILTPFSFAGIAFCNFFVFCIFIYAIYRIAKK